MRQVTVYSTVGQNRKTLSTNVATWGELQNELVAESINFSGMKVVIGETQLTLESPQAILPDSDFTLFMMPQKVKSGLYGFGNEGDGCGCEEDDDDEDYEDDDTSPLDKVRSKINEIGNLLNELYDLVDRVPESTDPRVSELKNKADELKRNLGIFE